MNELPRTHLSWSSYSLWKRDKDAFRRRYYENEKPFDTAETLFGKETDRRMEENDADLSYVPRYGSSEYEIEAVIHGTKIIGRIDSFDDKKIKFIERKTGHADKSGKAPWNKVKVRKHGQLVFYSMLLKERFGKVHDVCHLVWQETEFFKQTRSMGGHVLDELGKSRSLRLTGKIKKFSRRIQEWERKKLKTDLIVVIEQIKKDYAEYKQNSQRLHEQNGKVVAQETSSGQIAL